MTTAQPVYDSAEIWFAVYTKRTSMSSAAFQVDDRGLMVRYAVAFSAHSSPLATSAIFEEF